MGVSIEDRNEMARILQMMSGSANNKTVKSQEIKSGSCVPVELAGPGQITRAEVDAMSSVLNKLNSISNKVVDEILTESKESPRAAEAISTERLKNGVKVGRYHILEKEDQKRLAGKKFYSIYNGLTNDTIADDISLYETALMVVRMLNSGKFVNSVDVRRAFENDDAYTSHRVDALLYKRKMRNATDSSKRSLYESRYQASIDRCISAKKNIRELIEK